jgi:hypothetical protein
MAGRIMCSAAQAAKDVYCGPVGLTVIAPAVVLTMNVALPPGNASVSPLNMIDALSPLHVTVNPRAV